jgi:hypothetical protein
MSIWLFLSVYPMFNKICREPPKKYEDVVNVDFTSSDADGLRRALRDVVLFWIECGVTIFRVESHTNRSDSGSG